MNRGLGDAVQKCPQIRPPRTAVRVEAHVRCLATASASDTERGPLPRKERRAPERPSHRGPWPQPLEPGAREGVLRSPSTRTPLPWLAKPAEGCGLGTGSQQLLPLLFLCPAPGSSWRSRSAGSVPARPRQEQSAKRCLCVHGGLCRSSLQERHHAGAEGSCRTCSVSPHHSGGLPSSARAWAEPPRVWRAAQARRAASRIGLAPAALRTREGVRVP